MESIIQNFIGRNKMRSEEYLWDICMNIYRQMYKEANPSADFDELMKSGKTLEENWFMNYHLSGDRQAEIIKEWCDKHKCNKREREKISTTIYLGSAPTSVRKLVDDNKEYVEFASKMH